MLRTGLGGKISSCEEVKGRFGDFYNLVIDVADTTNNSFKKVKVSQPEKFPIGTDVAIEIKKAGKFRSNLKAVALK